ncbi:MAG TPA: FG-GAP-like repeat-containing protein [Thermoanaerobaculia bacterium]|nr:FG-GAP-like repeat-containing protein [Thermoanaerobaculia bacterium]
MIRRAWLPLIAVCLAVEASAATRTWSGTVSEAWSNPANWAEGVTPAAGDVLVFPPGARLNSTNDLPNVAYHSITVTGHAQLNVNSYTQGSPATTVTNGVTVGGSGAYLHGIVAAGTQTWTCTVTPFISCSFRGPIINGALTTQAGAHLGLQSPGGTGTITHTAGHLHLTTYPQASSTFDGTVTLNGGTLGMNGMHPAIDVQLNVACTWTGCTEGITIEYSNTQLRSLSASGGYVKTAAPLPSTFGALTLGAGTQADLAIASNMIQAFVVNGPVTLGGGTLTVRPSTHTYIAAGTVLNLIDNDGTDPIAGTFAGLPESATLRAINGQRFRISYVGNSGNDVTLTALAHFNGRNDFDNDGRSEVLWRHGTSGQNYRWIMNGHLYAGGAIINEVDPAWILAATADFDGDGDSDIFWRHSETGENYMYRMEGGAIQQGGPVNDVPDTNWEVAATGDLNGDGRADVIWRNELTDETYVYMMNGFTIERGGELRGAGPGWKIAAVDDFDVDGYADIIWNNLFTGEIYAWRMNGFAIVSEHSFDLAPGWEIVGAGQFNSIGHVNYPGDLRPDLVYWHRDAQRFEIYHTDEGFTRGTLQSGATVGDGWRIAAIADTNANGVSDLVWRNDLTGENFIYIFKTNAELGARYTPAALPDIPDLEWTIIP